MAGFGNIIYGKSVGKITPIGDILLTTVQNVVARQDILGSSYTQLDGYGTAEYAGCIIMTGDLGQSMSM